MPQVNPFAMTSRGLRWMVNIAYKPNLLKPVINEKDMEEIKHRYPEVIPYIDVITTKTKKKSILNILPSIPPTVVYKCHLNPYDVSFLSFVSIETAITSDDFTELVGLFSDIRDRNWKTAHHKQQLCRIVEIIGQSLKDTVKEDGNPYDNDDYLRILKRFNFIISKHPDRYTDYSLPSTKQKLNTTDFQNAKNLIRDLAFGLFDYDPDYVKCVFRSDPPGSENPEDDEVQEETKDPNHLLELVTDFVSLSDQSKFMGSFSVSKEVGKDNADIELVVKTKDSTFEYSISLETNLPRCSEMRFGKKPKEASDKSDVIDFVKDCVGVITKITKEN